MLQDLIFPNISEPNKFICSSSTRRQQSGRNASVSLEAWSVAERERLTKPLQH